MINLDLRISPHFKLREFISPNDPDGAAYLTANWQTFRPRLVKLATVLEKIRAHFKRPVTITSAVRSPKHNKRVGGAMFSQHKYAQAADLVIPGVTPKEIAAYAKTLPDVGGVGEYAGFTHVDVRPRLMLPVVFWKG